ncbi:UDP-N-acetylenolpyruvoylglucosamine reductase (plasmid) [Paraburkholderia dioscoreae]|uniref:UDP-N-acetylenolpyruvoylglucosamine reductase n=1 Tax=Paraburkholderia dioscoreae TaxID=2604047 RepID=A0A5Q4ZER3_9BURK|nr:UDP-N-acetylenolpyruvoylglucosamine reductase [Paraburkholderia dioscoreae]
MSSKPEFLTSHRLPKGSVWKEVKAELVGGTCLEGLPGSAGALPRVEISSDAFHTLCSGRRN